MSQQPVRLIHSGDWHLETPVSGIADVPAELREPLGDAPYVAAERVVQAALEHQVDLLLLTGNLLPLESACPYSFEFLLRQFQLLAEQRIDVYWLGAATDDLQLWPAQLSLPANVHCFPGHLHQFDHRRNGQIVTRLVGHASRHGNRISANDFAGGGDGIPRIAMASGEIQKRSLEKNGVDYWALGGENHHRLLLDGATTAVYAGSPQGHGPEDTDAHGAVLVELECGQAVTQLIETDVWRWRREQLDARELKSVEDVEIQLTRRLREIPQHAERFKWLLAWSVACRGELAWRLNEPVVRERLLERLREPATHEGRWSVKIDVEPCEVPAEWAEEDTVLGDFLRAVERYQQSPESWEGLAAFLPHRPDREELLRDMNSLDDQQRQRIWRCVAIWGADLLRGDVDMEQITAAP